jgi:hypothetical protein
MDYVTRFKRSGIVRIKADIEDVFPLLCPKREEEWIPGWQCELIWSASGFNEEGAIFKTIKPFGTELYWTTTAYDITKGKVAFVITAANLYLFKFDIDIIYQNDGFLVLNFTHEFTSISEAGKALVDTYRTEDYPERLKALEGFMIQYLNVRQ